MIKFFATNRAMEHLGRAVTCRDERLKLSKHGYYFVDMEKYMRFYLGTTDASRMPSDAVVKYSQQVVFEQFLCNPQIGKIVVCVHGFNVDLFEAFTWFRVLTDTMKNSQEIGDRIVTAPCELTKEKASNDELTAFVGFSWPSNGNILSYHSDQSDAISSAAAFGGLLARLKMTNKSINLICHSMGNFLACHTFKALLDGTIRPAIANDSHIHPLFEREEKFENSEKVDRSDWLIDNFVMLAADVERRHVTRCKSDDKEVELDYTGQFYSGLQHLVRHKINFYSRYDTVLRISDIEKDARETGFKIDDAASKLTFGLLDFLKRNPDQRWEKRLGEAPAPINAAPCFSSVNTTELANRKIGHSDHIDSKDIALRIAEELGI